MKIGVIGNTLLTKKVILELLRLEHDIKYVFGLSNKERSNKVNYTPLQELCENENIDFDDSGQWASFKKRELDLIISLGDSRIVPKSILDEYKVIGNHGAVLPYVQGGASLVWGRMLNTGEWGISIMELGQIVDSGKILATKKFKYAQECSMAEFVRTADDLTVECLLEVVSGASREQENKKYELRISKHADSEATVEIAKIALKMGINVYLPPRTPLDSAIKKQWGRNFIELFKVANNNPYPKWRIG